MNALPADAAFNQDNCPNGYYRRSNGIVIQLPESNQSPALPEVDINDATALRSLTKQVLVDILRLHPRTPALVPVCKELMDRVDGKATERVQVTGAVAMFDVNEGASLILEGIKEKLAKRKALILDVVPEHITDVK